MEKGEISKTKWFVMIRMECNVLILRFSMKREKKVLSVCRARNGKSDLTEHGKIRLLFLYENVLYLFTKNEISFLSLNYSMR